MIVRVKNKVIQIIGKAISRIRIQNMRNRCDLIEMGSKSRLPENILKECPEGVVKNSFFLASYMYYVRVLSDSLELVITYNNRRVLNNMPSQGTSGIEVYKVSGTNYAFLGCFCPHNKNGMYLKISLDGLKENDIIGILMPGYAQINHCFIDSNLAKVEEYYDYKGDIALYGSSITQGCAASRPGLCYANQLMINHGYKIHNFGFSESAKGEKTIIEYIAKKHSNVYVLEYDHNATISELDNTHEQVYKIVRENNPDALIILLSRISGGKSISFAEEEERASIIKRTYETAIKKGDRRIAFIRGRDLVADNASPFLSDDRHPNDEGMRMITDAIISKINIMGENK